jgi:hypothetical protein
MDKPQVSVIIVNYNVKDWILSCLKSLYAYIPETLLIETIVIDNNSSDDSVKSIKNDFPQVIMIENNYNAGFPKANNQGFEIAKGKYILMLNPDTEFLDDSLVKLYHYIENNPDIRLIAPMLLNTDGSRQLSVWRFPELGYIFCETHYLNIFLGKKNYADKDLTQPFEADCFSGSAILFNKNVFDKIEMLDETMFWIEDVEFCYRAKEAGMKLVYYPLAQVKHHIGQSAKKNYKISLSNQIFNKIKFFKKHHNFVEWQLVTILSFYHVLLKLIVFGLLSPFNKIYFKKAKAYLYTLPRVFNPPLGMK